MIFDLLFVLVLLAMVALGAWRGAVVSGAGLAGLLLGYAGAVWAALHGSSWVSDRLVVPPLVAPAIAGTIGFVLAWLVTSSVADVVVAWDRSRVAGQGRHFFDRGLGGLFGLARGGLIVVLLGLLVNWLDAGRDLGALDGLGAMPDAQASTIAGASGDLVGGAVARALSDAGPGGEVAGRIVARPGLALGSVQSILEDERLDGLFRDRLFWTLIQNESIDYAMNRNAIRQIVKDPELRGRFVDLGLVDEAAREDSSLFQSTLAGVLEEVAPKVERLHQDPEIRSLASDPEIIRLVESGDSLALLSHPRIRKIVDRISQDF